MESIYNLSEDDFKLYLNNLGEKPFRAKQIMEWVYRHKIESFDEMTNVKKTFIEQLKKDFSLDLLEVVTHQISSDGTQKFLFRLKDGNLIESVLMNNEYGYSICVTTQVGCNMGCVFCASGMKKRLRNLETAEIIMQLLTVEKVTGIKITHIVIMGIGEPFDNYENVTRFMKIVNYPLGLEIGARHITVSTSGLIPGIEKYSNEKLQTNLAVSLHAPNNELRNKIMPVNKAYDIDKLIDAIKKYIDKTNRRVTIEYLMLNEVNDTKECALELANLLKGLNVYVNLIPYNETSHIEFKKSSNERVMAFYDTLKKQGINVTVRRRFGSLIDAACGQLRANEVNK